MADEHDERFCGFHGFNRRQFLEVSLGGLAAARLAAAGIPVVRSPVADAIPAGAAGSLPVVLRVNGAERRLSVDPRTTLLEAMRYELGLTGTKEGCDHGQCGACTVLIGGRRVLSCMTLTVAAGGQAVTTIEGLAKDGELHPVQAAFLARDGFQCGYCTPGQIVSAVGLLAEGCPGDAGAIRECMSGNICRCGAYPNIVAAIQDARSKVAAIQDARNKTQGSR
ncbi:MAG TPA: (2Fe-2S)-binding protein [Thermoanaerobaculia bacterium]